jgi:hypothetical protein
VILSGIFLATNEISQNIITTTLPKIYTIKCTFWSFMLLVFVRHINNGIMGIERIYQLVDFVVFLFIIIILTIGISCFYYCSNPSNEYFIENLYYLYTIIMQLLYISPVYFFIIYRMDIIDMESVNRDELLPHMLTLIQSTLTWGFVLLGIYHIHGGSGGLIVGLYLTIDLGCLATTQVVRCYPY